MFEIKDIRYNLQERFIFDTSLTISNKLHGVHLYILNAIADIDIIKLSSATAISNYSAVTNTYRRMSNRVYFLQFKTCITPNGVTHRPKPLTNKYHSGCRNLPTYSIVDGVFTIQYWIHHATIIMNKRSSPFIRINDPGSGFNARKYLIKPIPPAPSARQWSGTHILYNHDTSINFFRYLLYGIIPLHKLHYTMFIVHA